MLAPLGAVKAATTWNSPLHSGARTAYNWLGDNAGPLGAVAGAGMGIAGSLMQARGLKARGKAEQAAAEYNARLAEIQSYREARRIRSDARQQASSSYVQMAGKSGVIGASGGWLEVLVSNAETAERSAVEALIAGRSTAALNRSRGSLAASQAKRQAGAALLSGTTQAFGAVGRLYT